MGKTPLGMPLVTPETTGRVQTRMDNLIGISDLGFFYDPIEKRIRKNDPNYAIFIGECLQIYSDFAQGDGPSTKGRSGCAFLTAYAVLEEAGSIPALDEMVLKKDLDLTKKTALESCVSGNDLDLVEEDNPYYHRFLMTISRQVGGLSGVNWLAHAVLGYRMQVESIKKNS